MTEAPRLCVVGTSNSVSAGGYGRGLFQDPGFASSRNASLGMCCSDLFAFQRLGPEEVPSLALAGFVARRAGESLPFRRLLPEAMDLVALMPDAEFAAHRAALSGGR